MNTSITFEINGVTWSGYFNIEGEVSIFCDGELCDQGTVVNGSNGESLIHDADHTPEAVLCILDDHWNSENVGE
jgi:hypothetical protein